MHALRRLEIPQIPQPRGHFRFFVVGVATALAHSWCSRRNGTELLQQAQEVRLAPAFDALATSEAEYGHPWQRYAVAGRGNALKVALVRSLYHKATRDRIPFGNYISKREDTVRE